MDYYSVGPTVAGQIALQATSITMSAPTRAGWQSDRALASVALPMGGPFWLEEPFHP